MHTSANQTLSPRDASRLLEQGLGLLLALGSVLAPLLALLQRLELELTLVLLLALGLAIVHLLPWPLRSEQAMAL